MKHVSTISFLLVITVAVCASFVLAKVQQTQRIERLLASSSSIDVLEGIKLLQSASFDQVQEQLQKQLQKQRNPVLIEKNKASKAAQQLLIHRAFIENRIRDVQANSIDPDLYSSALWWDSDRQNQAISYFSIEDNASPWVMRLASFYWPPQSNGAIDSILLSPLKDRDGSVLLAVLAIERHATPEIVQETIQSWASSYDVDKQKAAILLAALSGVTIPPIPTSNAPLLTLIDICKDKNTTLAWRALHQEDGFINPDFALAAMIINQTQFLPILIESVENGIWHHPEHPILIATRCVPSVARKLPFKLLKDDETRKKWWSLFTCGLLRKIQ